MATPSRPPPSKGGAPRTTKLRAALLLAAVFVLGGVSGAAVMRWQIYEDLRATMSLPPGEARARFRLDAMRRHLDLTDEQATRIEQVLLEYYRTREELEAPCHATLEEHREKVRTQIDEVLTPEQRVLHEEARERWRKRRGSR